MMTALATSGDFDRELLELNQGRLRSPTPFGTAGRHEQHLGRNSAPPKLCSARHSHTSDCGEALRVVWMAGDGGWLGAGDQEAQGAASERLGYLDPIAIELVLQAINSPTGAPMAVPRTLMCAMAQVCAAVGIDFDRVVRCKFFTTDSVEGCTFVAAGGRGTLNFSDSHVVVNYNCEQMASLSVVGRFAYRIDSQSDHETCFRLFSAVPMSLRLLPGGSLVLELYAADQTLVHSWRFEKEEWEE